MEHNCAVKLYGSGYLFRFKRRLKCRWEFHGRLHRIRMLINYGSFQAHDATTVCIELLIFWCIKHHLKHTSLHMIFNLANKILQPRLFNSRSRRQGTFLNSFISLNIICPLPKLWQYRPQITLRCVPGLLTEPHPVTSQEEELRAAGDPKFSHLSEDLHVEVTAFAPPAEAYARMAYALTEVRRFLVPVSERSPVRIPSCLPSCGRSLFRWFGM